MKKAGRPSTNNKREIEIRIRVTESENDLIEQLSDQFNINKSRLIRNIVLGDISDYSMLSNIGLIPIVKKAIDFLNKNFGVIDHD